ncbi:MAG: ribosome rescue protein RqcH [Candidatus Hodarchaeales archaeon]|jgi:predicted ribosome quality control (RQC) complex YloA/Tae2 family protein
MKQMSNLDIFAICKEMQEIIGYRVDNIYRDIGDSFYLFKLKGKGKFKNPFLLIEPGRRIHLSEYKYSVPERPSDKVLSLRGHLKGAIISAIHQVEFDRLIEFEIAGKQTYRVYVELFGSKPNFVVVGEADNVIFATWYKKMRHRDVLPGKKFALPPSRGQSILSVNISSLSSIINDPDHGKEEIVKVLARNLGGGGFFMEEILFRASIPKNTICEKIGKSELDAVFSTIQTIRTSLSEINASISLNDEGLPIDFHPIQFKSDSHEKRIFDNFSSALDYYYLQKSPKISPGLTRYQQRRKQLDKVLESQQKTLEKYEKQKILFKKIGDEVYLYLQQINDLLGTILTARKNKISWEEINGKLKKGKQKGIQSAQFFRSSSSKKGTIVISLKSEEIEVDIRLTATEIANEYYERAKKASRKIPPAREAIQETLKKLESINQDIDEKEISDSVTLKRRKRKWFEKYHWTYSINGFLIIGGRDISSNDEIAKKRMSKEDLFFHAEVQGAPYTILIRNSSENEVSEEDIHLAAKLAAVYSSGWKAGYGALDVYYVDADAVGFSAPSGEFIPRGGIMVRGTRNYLRGVEMRLAVGYVEEEFNVSIIYGSIDSVRLQSPVVISLKPGSISKGKIAKQILTIFAKKAKTLDQKAKIKALDLNEIVQAVPHNSNIVDVFTTDKE